MINIVNGIDDKHCKWKVRQKSGDKVIVRMYKVNPTGEMFLDCYLCKQKEQHLGRMCVLLMVLSLKHL